MGKASRKITPKFVGLHYNFFVGLHYTFLFCGFTLQLFLLRVFILPLFICWFSVAQQLLFSLVQELSCLEGGSPCRLNLRTGLSFCKLGYHLPFEGDWLFFHISHCWLYLLFLLFNSTPNSTWGRKASRPNNLCKGE